MYCEKGDFFNVYYEFPKSDDLFKLFMSGFYLFRMAFSKVILLYQTAYGEGNDVVVSTGEN